MEYRLLGGSGLKVSVLTMGTMTFGGKGNFAKVGNVGLDEVRRLIDLVADAGVNMIDTADVYSGGGSEELIGEAMGGKRKPGMLIATKARFPTGPGPNDRGLSRWHLIEACEASLKRLRTDVIDLYQVHQWDGQTPLEETMEALDGLVRAGKVRYVGCSNFSGWHVMKAMEVGAPRPPHPLRFAADPLHAAGARGGIRTDPDRDRPEARRARLEPHRRRPALGQASARQGRAGGHAADGGLERAADQRTRASSGTSSTRWSRSARGRAFRRRASRSPGCSADRASLR